MKPGKIMVLAMQALALAVWLVLSAVDPVYANEAPPSTLDGQSRAQGIRQWIEIAEPSNLGLLFMGIAGLLIGRWAAGKKRKGPPDQ
jgi:hypothetical protein